MMEAGPRPQLQNPNFKGGVRWLFLCLLLNIAGRMFRESLLGNREMAGGQTELRYVLSSLTYFTYNYLEQMIWNRLIKNVRGNNMTREL